MEIFVASTTFMLAVMNTVNSGFRGAVVTNTQFLTAYTRIQNKPIIASITALSHVG
jgi:hypothetical protein